MDKQTLQQLKMAWLAARESGDTQSQIALLRDHPGLQDDLVAFIAAYHATDIDTVQNEQLLPMTQRAMQTALERVFTPQTAFANLRELRTQRGLNLVNAAKGLRLSADVWKKFESGLIDLASLTEKQLERLARFFNVSVAQFGTLLASSQPAMTMNRRQTASGARQEKQDKKPQSFSEAVEKSAMTKEEKRLWLE